ncbi:Ecdysis triggering hormone receptor subtype-A, partial [Operophtera brumata]
FERYYAICEPLRAGYVCTKTRATLICALVWFFAALFTSPILAIAEHHTVTRQDGSNYAQCLTQAITFWPIAFFVMIIILLYILPLIILIILYSIIAKNLITAASKVVMNKTFDPYNARARKQVILMLGTVVLCFFLCLMPYRALTLWVIMTPAELYDEVTPEKWYNILYFSRVMLYINSAINPILYNLMSSKFRIGFCKICICYSKSEDMNRRNQRTITNGSTTSSSLTRTTNSLKKFFSHRGSVDKSEAEPDSKDESENKTLFDRIFASKAFVRQQSAPICSSTVQQTPVINRMNSEGSIDILEAETSVGKIHSNNKIEDDRHGSLRRSVLINSAKAKGTDDKKVCYQKKNIVMSKEKDFYPVNKNK